MDFHGVLARVHSLPTGLVDVVIAVAVTMASVGPAVVVGASWPIVGLSFLASAPVLWRRRAPIGVLLVVGPAITLLACLHVMPALPYGTIVCAYTIAAYSPRGRRRGALVAVAIGILIADATFAGIADTGRAAVQQLRRSLGAPRGEAADPRHQPGIEAIPDLVEMSRRGGLSASFDEYGQRRSVSGEVGVTAYRVVQEALTNTMKHARASRVRVSLGWSDDRLTVRVCDDGRGAVSGPRGHGLLGMRERVTGSGGTLQHGQSSSGFDVAAELPIAQGS
jgi:hypothetical protein